MALLCSDLLYLNILKGLKQVAGFEGSKNSVEWVCKVNILGISGKTYGNINKGDLVIVFGDKESIKTTEILVLIEEAYKREASGLIVCFNMCIGNLTHEVIEMSDKLKFPVFEMYNYNSTAGNITKEICKAIIVGELNDASEQNILDCILNNDNLDNDYIIERLRIYGMNINNNNQIGIIKFEGFEEYVKEKYIKDREIMDRIGPELNDIVKTAAARLSSPRNIITSVKRDCVTFLTLAFDDKDEIEGLLARVHKEMRDKIPGTNLSFGLGGGYKGVAGINKSLREAKQMLILKQVEGMPGLSASFPHFDVYLLLMGLKDRKLLEKYLNKVLKPLIDYDKLSQTDLIDTLDSYLNENASTIEAADKLFIHKNTLKYRLKKIESLLDVDLHSLEDCLRLLLAVKIYKLFKLSSEQKIGDSN
jgi:sugar diacid utilization regulator